MFLFEFFVKLYGLRQRRIKMRLERIYVYVIENRISKNVRFFKDDRISGWFLMGGRQLTSLTALKRHTDD